MIRGLVGIYLGICSLADLKNREIPLWLTGGFGLLGIILECACRYLSWPSWLGGILIGVFLLGVSRITREALGYGDGLVMMAAGSYLGVGEGIELLAGGLTLAACMAAVLLGIKKADKKKRIPFVPFLFLTHVLVSLLEWGDRL